MNRKLFFLVHFIFVLCMVLHTNTLFAQRPPRVSKNVELSNQSNLVTQQPVKGRLDVDTRTLKEGKNVVCQNPKTGKVLVAVVKKGQIVSWEIETNNPDSKATAQTTASTTFTVINTQQNKLNAKENTQTARSVVVHEVYQTNQQDNNNSVNCQTITCTKCAQDPTVCEKCKNCFPSGIDPPILVSEGNGVIIEGDGLQYTLTNWSDVYETAFDTYSYNYTPYITIISPQVFTSMGW